VALASAPVVAYRTAVKRSDKSARIQGILNELYPAPPIPLDHADPFTLLVAVMLSAQTTDKKVNEVTPALFARASTAEAMAALEVATIQESIRTVGLAPTKAKNLKRMSELLVERHSGVVPSDIDALEALPGVGHKTAQVVMAQAFGVPSFPVDTHIHRLAARWGLSSGKNVEQTERDLERTFARDTWNALHLQIIYFGREHCPARGHDLTRCPICSWAASKARLRIEATRRAGPRLGPNDYRRGPQRAAEGRDNDQ
jgi:endonuclease-3